MLRHRSILALAAALAAAAAVMPTARAAAPSSCLKEPVNAAGLAPEEPLAAYKARANWDAQVRMHLGSDWSQWGAAEGATVTCGKSERGGGHFCVAHATPCRMAGR